MHPAHSDATMTYLPKTILLTPLALALGCNNLCGDVSPVSDASGGSFTYVQSNAPKPGSATTSGNVASGLEISATQNGAISVAGTFTDVGGQVHAFTLDVPNISSNTTAPLSAESELWFDDCAPGDDDGSCDYIDQTTYPVTGSISTESFSTDCHASEGCALSIVGTLHATADWGEARFVVDLTLNHDEVWETFACSTSSSDSS